MRIGDAPKSFLEHPLLERGCSNAPAEAYASDVGTLQQYLAAEGIEAPDGVAHADGHPPLRELVGDRGLQPGDHPAPRVRDLLALQVGGELRARGVEPVRLGGAAEQGAEDAGGAVGALAAVPVRAGTSSHALVAKTQLQRHGSSSRCPHGPPAAATSDPARDGSGRCARARVPMARRGKYDTAEAVSSSEAAAQPTRQPWAARAVRAGRCGAAGSRNAPRAPRRVLQETRA